MTTGRVRSTMGNQTNAAAPVGVGGVSVKEVYRA
jgi:hypothetical protein